MEFIPIIYIKNKRLLLDKKSKEIHIDEILNYINKDRRLYVLDMDGLKKNVPNLSIYNRLSHRFELWVDAGVRVLEDIMDVVMAGANSITIRKDMFNERDISIMDEIIDSKIYIKFDPEEENNYKTYQTTFLSPVVDGAVVFSEKDQIDTDFKYSEIMKSFCNRYKTYVYDSDSKNASYWKRYNVKGLLVELDKIKEFEKNGL